ncbi:shikimate dehydrogenase [Phreatobacter sp.]|uniref:shikimate dehydrogenase n=1 Tax=Phreatobacter sp. TaxID=1966341 RepID=UPI003F6F201C
MIRACVVGWPISHSRSPMIHGHWIETFGIDGAYGREAVAPEDFAGFITTLADRGYAGCNVTLPHKEQALAMVEDADAAARAVGAVNTVWLEGGRLRGANTDVPGFLASLDASAPGWDSGLDHAVVLGAGGAARGIVHGLIERGAGIVTVANRSADRAERLVSDHPVGRISATALADVGPALQTADLLVNTTSLGMKGQPALDLPLDSLKSSALVTDIVYVPLETDLLRAARLRGHPTVGGLGMLLHQAVPGFARWFGRTPAVTTALYDLVAADIGRS